MIIINLELIQIKQLKKRITQYLPEVMVLVGFVLYYLSQFKYTTMFQFPFTMIKIVKYSGLLLIALKVIIFDRKKYSMKQYLLIFVVMVLLIITAIFSTYRIFLEYLLVILGFRNINYKKVLYCFMITCSISLLITMFCSKVGIVENVIRHRSNGTIRESFGIVFPTDFAAYFFYLFSVYICLNDSPKPLKIFILLEIAILVYSVTNARLDFICMVIVSAVYWGLPKVSTKILDSLFSKLVLKNMFLICGIVIVILTFFYSPNIKILQKLDSVLTTRLSLGQKMYEKYGIKLWGQEIEEHGFGGATQDLGKYKMEFIDSSYVKMIVKYGIVATAIVSIYSLVLTYKFMDRKKYKIVCVFAVIFINSMIAHHYLEIAYNFLIPLLLCNLDDKDELVNK